MSPRAKTITDSQLIATAMQVVATRGADRTRLADVAAAAGLAPATLVQRFGSREGLLRAVGDAHLARIVEAFSSRAAGNIDRLVRALEVLYAEGHLVFLAANPASAAAYSLELRKQIGFALLAAVETSELAPCDVALQARRVQLSYYGVVTAGLLERDLGSGAAIPALVRETLGDFV